MAAATIAQTLNVFLLFALPVEALKFPSVPMIESPTRRMTGGFELVGNQQPGIPPRTGDLRRYGRRQGLVRRIHGLSPSSGFPACQFEGKSGIDDDLPADLCNRLVDLAALLDAVGRRHAAAEQPAMPRMP